MHRPVRGKSGEELVKNIIFSRPGGNLITLRALSLLPAGAHGAQRQNHF